MGLIGFKVYYDGTMQVSLPEFHYEGGKVSYLNELDSDLLTHADLDNIVKNGLCDKVVCKYHFRVPGLCLRDGLRLCWSESFNDLIELAKAHNEHIELYVEHEELEFVALVSENLTNQFEYVNELFGKSGIDGVNSDDDEVASLDHVSEGDADELVYYREKRREEVTKRRIRKAKRNVKKGKGKQKVERKSTSSEGDDIPVSEGDHVSQGNANEKSQCEEMNTKRYIEGDSEEELEGSDIDDFLEEIRSCSKPIDPDEYVSDYEDSDIDFDDPKIDSDDESERPSFKTMKWPVFDPKIKWKFQEPATGMLFKNTGDLKHCITNYAVANGREIWFQRLSTTEVLARCKQGCPWRCYASPLQMENTIQVKSYNGEHCETMCVLNFKVKLVTSSWLAREYKSKIRQNPKWDLIQFQAAVKKKHQVIVTLIQCYKARHIALAEVEAALVEHYSKLWDYKEEILRSNPGSTVVLEGKESEDGKKQLFDKMYICFDALKKGWKAGCRAVVGLDGCFLKSFVSGQLLCAVGRDGNNHMFPIAWAVVQVESTETWTWFMELFKQDIGTIDGFGLTFISDEQKGLLNGLQHIFPQAEHRNCARHIYANFRKHFAGQQLKNLFWDAARSGTKEEFLNVMDDIKKGSIKA